MIDMLELLTRLYKRAAEGFYDDMPPYQFSKDELSVKYCIGWIDEGTYFLEKQQLEQRIEEYYCRKHRSIIY